MLGKARHFSRAAGLHHSQIKQLINESVGKIATGSTLAHTAGNTMTEVVASVEQVTAIMAQIASASSEQETGINEINVAVADMDNVTQQNATLVEEAAATAELVHAEATKLMEFVGFFTIDDSQLNGQVLSRSARKDEPIYLDAA